MSNGLSTALFAVMLLVEAAAVWGQPDTRWDILVDQTLQGDEAVRVALRDLQETGLRHGIHFTVRNGPGESPHAIVVGSPDRNVLTAQLVNQQNLRLQALEDAQAFEILTRDINGRRTVIVAGASLLGDVYGLYWIWDRIRVFKTLPDINVTRSPALKTRICLSWARSGSAGESEAQMQQALQYTCNWVSGPAVLDLVPWNAEPERSRNAENRERTRRLIDTAHALHLQYYSFANEFTYHPSLLAELDASLTPDDPRFWQALQEKYRRLFRALPELDGIELCNDDISGFWDNYRAFDVMHEGEGCEWRYDKRFRTFVKKVHDVVVGEFDKTYFHFTWSLVPYEQGSEPNMFRWIFTEEVPVKNLYLIPKITAADRWWHQPYNPTFNLTPHQTVVGFETMNYYESSQSNLFPTFAGQYYQAGLQSILRHRSSNVSGAGYLVGGQGDGWDTRSVYAYVLFRLSWNPDEDIQQIAEDFCAIHFGRAAARAMAEIYLLTPVAYKYGLHIEPVSYGQFNSFVHMRVGTFPAQGYPSIDDGKEHLDFLHGIYLRCKPWMSETIEDLDHGLETVETMVDKFASAQPLIADVPLAQQLKNALNMTRLLIHTNNLYVKTAFAYFAYRENATPQRKKILHACYAQLTQIRDEFRSTPGFGYRLFGVDQLLKNTGQVLVDLDEAERRLALMPTRDELERTIAQQQQAYRRLLQTHAAQAVKFLHFEVEVDGRDILIVQGKTYRIEHLRWDGPSVRQCQFMGQLPREVVTVVPHDIASRPIHPFVLQQPTEENDYTAKIYLYDKPGGVGIVSLDLYYIPTAPEALGLKPRWEMNE